ncbi:MAG: isopentenyl-diphosphate Delta-isomerase [Kiritimatiellae bacterium]|nr:isopentenyl-diphosphate Delta-isomerase [Kiritimatiellia bacterium]MDD4341137.1 isopentenyl-diphosphate Delta-isomerase [Kiritimatiellia bacterium]
MTEEQVILVDEQDRAIGAMEKVAAHENGGVRHRAFSVFIFDAQGRWLLQKRADGKYHFPGLWTNACCSHPRPGEATAAAAHRRLGEELGMDCPLTERFQFEYRAVSDAVGLTEHEIDHVFTGVFDGDLNPNPDEVGEVRWVTPTDLQHDLQANPAAFTPWFKLAVPRVRAGG